jgi:hypothetical protein
MPGIMVIPQSLMPGRGIVRARLPGGDCGVHNRRP